MPDPTGIDWTSSSIFNPSIIEKDGSIYLFYRAAVKKESLGSRIGLAIYSQGTGWRESSKNPILYPTQENEILSVEDPKVYCYGQNKYIMFYNGAWAASPEQIIEYAKPDGEVAVDIQLLQVRLRVNEDGDGRLERGDFFLSQHISKFYFDN